MRKEITKEYLFDLVAPIHIYFVADLQFKKEAQKAFRRLKQIKIQEIITLYFEGNMEVFEVRYLDKIDYRVFSRVYNHLFEETVLTSYPTLQSTYDKYGAKCFKLGGQTFLDGDNIDCFPFYLDMEALERRLANLADEIEEKIKQ